MLPLLLMALQLPPAADDSTLAMIRRAEHSRAPETAQLAILEGALASPDTAIQLVATRALGRLEREDLIPALTPMLGRPSASVRMAAANAVAQAAYRGDGGAALTVLAGRLQAEPDPVVRGALLSAMGRLRLGGPESDGARQVQAALTDALGRDGAQVSGALRGTWDLLRRQGRAAAAGEALASALRLRLVTDPRAEDRRLALMALTAGNVVDSADVATGTRDADAQVRRLAVLAARTGRGIAGRNRVFQAALHDPAVMVRIEAVRGWAAHGRTTEGCQPLILATRDSALAVQLLAIDALGGGCGPMEAPREMLEAMAGEPLAEAAWHRPMHALAALANVDSGRAGIRLASFATAPIWWVRMHAAEVAQRLGDRTTLRRLVSDSVDNVREAALRGLVALEGRAADSVAIAQLARRDYQLVLTAAKALQGSALGPSVAEASLRAFRRISLEKRQTSRDPRLALLERIQEFGTPAMASGLTDALQDVDPAVATQAARIITQLSGMPTDANPREPPPARLPDRAALEAMTSATIVLGDGTRLELELRPSEAPYGVARFVAMARSGWFNGLTLHRVVPNFVLQGGSPGANEYVGAPDFERDEVGGIHLRGTVGISTRGRDTQDGQLFFNLVDNLNLDHEYTVIGAVVRGIDRVDYVAEGAVIVRVEVPGR